jgi:hypothetical protein
LKIYFLHAGHKIGILTARGSQDAIFDGLSNFLLYRNKKTGELETLPKNQFNKKYVFAVNDPKTKKSLNLKAGVEGPQEAKAKILQDIFKMMGLEIPHIQIELPFKRPKDLASMAAYQDYYGQDVKFDCDQAAFILDDIQILQIKVPSADTLIYRVYEEKCLQDLAKLEKNENLKLTVVEYVEDYLEMQNGVIPTMAETACALNMPGRTLRHQLQQMQTSYKEIRERLIKQKALKSKLDSTPEFHKRKFI